MELHITNVAVAVNEGLNGRMWFVKGDIARQFTHLFNYYSTQTMGEKYDGSIVRLCVEIQFKTIHDSRTLTLESLRSQARWFSRSKA